MRLENFYRAGLFFGPLAKVCAGLFLFVFIVFPMANFQKLMGPFAGRIEHFTPFLLFAIASAGGAFWLASITLKRVLNAPYLNRPAPLRSSGLGQSRSTLIAVAGSVLVFTLVLSNIDAPLHWEDNFHLSNIVVDPVTRFNPLIKTEHHTVASVPAWLAVEALGFSKWSVKLPAVLFTLTFLITLVVFCRRYLAWGTTLLIFANLSANEMARWYMHSMRGYIASMLLAFCSLFIFWDLSQGMPDKPNRRTALFLAVAFGCLFTHLFASLFCLIATVTYLVWFCVNMEEIEPKRRLYSLNLLGIFTLVAVPVFLFVFYHQALWLERLGDFFKTDFPDVSKAVLHAMGIAFEWPSRLILVLMVALCLYRWSTERKWYRDYHFLFVIASVLFFAAVLKILRVRMLETRFILPFLVPYLIWVGESIRRIQIKRVQVAFTALVVGVLVLVPTQSAPGLYNYLTLNVREFDKFMKVTHEKAAPLNQSCFTYHGEPNLIYFAETLYLGDLQNVKKPPQCKQKFHIFFETPEELPAIDTRPKGTVTTYQVVYNQNQRMVLYRENDDPGSRIANAGAPSTP